MEENNNKVKYSENEDTANIIKELNKYKKFTKICFYDIRNKLLDVDMHIKNYKNLSILGFEESEKKSKQIENDMETNKDLIIQAIEFLEKKVDNMQKYSEESFIELKEDIDEQIKKINKRTDKLISIIFIMSAFILSIATIYVITRFILI